MTFCIDPYERRDSRHAVLVLRVSFMCRNTQSSAVNSAAPVLGTSPGASFPAGTSPGGRTWRGHAYSPGSQQQSKWFVQVSSARHHLWQLEYPVRNVGSICITTSHGQASMAQLYHPHCLCMAFNMMRSA